MSTNEHTRIRPPAPGLARIILARGRFLLVFAAVFATIGGWETIRARLARLTAGRAPEAPISSDTEYFCPMDPGVLSDWPSKCPACNMGLVRRRRGEAAALPDGVVARMQVAPDRLVLGGIATAAVGYAPLSRTLELPGVAAAGRRVEAEVFARELGWIEVGRAVEVVEPDGRAPMPGRIRELPEGVEPGSVGRVVVDVDRGGLRNGSRVIVRATCPFDRVEPFRGLPTAPPPLAPGEPRRLFACDDHPESARDAPGSCPRDGLELRPKVALADQRIRRYCPMHPGVTADRAGSSCEACGGMALVPRIVSYRPAGQVLALPASALVVEGARAVGYVERGGGMFDARPVVLGPRSGALVAVASGVEPGERVVARGAFLLDAEARLDPSLASGYFGAGRAGSNSEPPTPTSTPRAIDGPLAALAPADRAAAIRQRTCPVTGKPLGSMGTPPRVDVRGRAVFLCCSGCAGAVAADPDAALAKLPREGPP